MRARRAGFTYVELLITTVIVCVLYLMVLGPGSALGQSRSKARCAAQLQQLHQCLAAYATEHNGAFPVITGATTSEAPLSTLVPLYTTDTSLFICPGSKDPGLPGAEPFANRRISYAYYMGLKSDAPPGTAVLSDAQATTAAKHSGEPLFSTNGAGPGNKHRSYGGNVLFTDGSVETYRAQATRDFPLPAGVTLLNPHP
jgi:prepilin-type processing-associated H-X9-DG protein